MDLLCFFFLLFHLTQTKRGVSRIVFKGLYRNSHLLKTCIYPEAVYVNKTKRVFLTLSECACDRINVVRLAVIADYIYTTSVSLLITDHKYVHK